jgi:hypothetical protein
MIELPVDKDIRLSRDRIAHTVVSGQACVRDSRDRIAHTARTGGQEQPLDSVYRLAGRDSRDRITCTDRTGAALAIKDWPVGKDSREGRPR